MAEPIQTFTAAQLLDAAVAFESDAYQQTADILRFAVYLVEQLQQIRALPKQWRERSDALTVQGRHGDYILAVVADELDAILKAHQ